MEQQKGKKEQIDNTIKILKEDIKSNGKVLHEYEKAREVIRAVGLKTQQQLQFHISDITSTALETVFSNH